MFEKSPGNAKSLVRVDDPGHSMPALQTWTTLCLLSLMAVLAVQPAAALSGYYSEPGHCGGTAPAALACTSQHIDVPSGTTSWGVVFGIEMPLCPTIPCGVGTIRVDIQVTGFSPTSYDPAFVSTSSCYVRADDTWWCEDGARWGTFAPGYDFVVAGQISTAVCSAACVAPPPVADWCVGVGFNGHATCRLDGPLEGPAAGTVRTLGQVLAIEVQHGGSLP